MEKKPAKKAPASKKKAAAPKKKIVKKVEVPILAPEATPYVAYHDDNKSESKVSFLDKVKKFLGL